MKIEYQRFDFAKGTVETREREIDTEKLLAGNAFFGRLKAKAAADDKKPKDSA